MGRLQLAVLALWLYPACIVAAASPAGQAPITSKAALTRYLHDTPPGTSPLDHLAPGGRKRFLAQLDFGPRGLRGMSLEDPANELTHPQIVQPRQLAVRIQLKPPAHQIAGIRHSHETAVARQLEIG